MSMQTLLDKTDGDYGSDNPAKKISHKIILCVCVVSNCFNNLPPFKMINKHNMLTVTWIYKEQEWNAEEIKSLYPVTEISIFFLSTVIISPVSISVHQCELESDEAVEVWVIVPCRFVQEENIPVGGDEHDAGEAVKTAEHDTNSACVKHARTHACTKVLFNSINHLYI